MQYSKENYSNGAPQSCARGPYASGENVGCAWPCNATVLSRPINIGYGAPHYLNFSSHSHPRMSASSAPSYERRLDQCPSGYSPAGSNRGFVHAQGSATPQYHMQPRMSHSQGALGASHAFYAQNAVMGPMQPGGRYMPQRTDYAHMEQGLLQAPRNQRFVLDARSMGLPVNPNAPWSMMGRAQSAPANLESESCPPGMMALPYNGMHPAMRPPQGPVGGVAIPIPYEQFQRLQQLQHSPSPHQMPLQLQQQMQQQMQLQLAQQRSLQMSQQRSQQMSCQPSQELPRPLVTSPPPTGENSAMCCRVEESDSQQSCVSEESLEMPPPKPLSAKEECIQKQMTKYCEKKFAANNEAARINRELNDIFASRVNDVECKAQGDSDLMLITYKEWVEMLLEINESVLRNMEELERDIMSSWDTMEKKREEAAASEKSAECEAILNGQKDIATLLKVIKNGYFHQNWDLQGMQFHTIDPDDILCINESRI